MQHDDQPSAVRDMYAPGETGLHHLAYFVDDLDETARRLEALRATRRPRSPRPAAAPASPSTTPSPQLGHMFELYQPSSSILGFYAKVAEAARRLGRPRPDTGVTLTDAGRP